MEVGYPEDFKCPISLEVMSDPVILSSGHTFDRVSIQRWLDSGNRTCPVTKLPLPSRPSLIPNHALRSLISNFTPSRSQKLRPCPSDPQTLISSLSFPSNSQTLTQLLRLVKDSAAFRRHVSDSAVPSLLLRHVSSGDHPDLQDISLRILLHLSLDGDDIKVGLVADGAIDPIVAALRGDSAALAATTLTSLSMVEVNKCTIGAHPSAIGGLVSLLRDGKSRERREAATALYVLCSFPENRIRAVRFGVVRNLIELVGSGSERAVEVLGLVGKCREGREEMGRVDGFVKVLASVLKVGSFRAIEHALLVLNLVCLDREELGLEARREGVLEDCFNLVGEENEKIRNNALGLARTLERGELSDIF